MDNIVAIITVGLLGLLVILGALILAILLMLGYSYIMNLGIDKDD